MTDRRVPLAWTMFAVSVALAVVQVVVLVRARTPLISGEFSDDGFPVITLAAVVAAWVGALVVTRHPGHRIGWLFLVGQVGTMFGLALQAYGFNALTDGFGSRSLAQVAIWLSILTGGIFAFGLMALLLLLAPDGHLLSRRWRWAVWVTVLGFLVHDAAVLTVAPSRLDAEARVVGDAGLMPLFSLVGGSAVLGGLVAGAVSLVLRMRRAQGEERAQLRWIGAAALSLAASIPLAVLLEVAFDTPVWAANLPLMLGYLAVPVFTGIAILRFRLYDIDVLLNRSIVLALLTGFVAAAYVVVVVLLGRQDAVGPNSSWTPILATAFAALAFQPLRSHVVRLADRMVYGERAVPYEALATFNEELRVGVAPHDLLPRMAQATGRMLGAHRVRVWVDRSDEAPLTATWSGAAGQEGNEESFPVVDDGELLGGLAVCMPRGRGLRASERRLLEDFAAQLGAAFRAQSLEAALADRVAMLAVRRRQLEESRVRLLAAQEAERARFEGSIAREVLPHVADLPAVLRSLQADVEGGGRWPGVEVDRLIAGAAASLEALRNLTRGVFPAQLARRGLVPALATHLQLAGAGHELTTGTGLADRRFSGELESVAYFCAVETVRAMQGRCRVRVDAGPHVLSVTVEGRAGPTLVAATEHLVDRAEAVQGRMRRELGGAAACVTVELPLGSAVLAKPDRAELVGAED
jgi:hypothetical protein